jgi:hypothetical protein
MTLLKPASALRTMEINKRRPAFLKTAFCEVCGREFFTRRAHARTDSARCRKKLSRSNKAKSFFFNIVK